MADPTKIIVPQGAAVEAEKSLSSFPQVRFLTTGVPPPGAFYLHQDDQLAVLTFSDNPATLQTLIVRGRFLRTDGVVIPIETDLALLTGIQQQVVPMPLGEGYLLGLTAFPSGTGVVPGSLYVSISVVRKAFTQVSVTQCLAAGIATFFTPVSWPTSGVRLATDSQGQIRSITGTVPAAGAEISEAVPGNVRWRLISFRYALTTAVAIANRQSQVILDDGALEYFRASAATAQAASLTDVYTFAPGMPDQGLTATVQLIPAPFNGILGSGHRIRTLTALIQAADQYTAPQYVVEEWLTGS